MMKQKTPTTVFFIVFCLCLIAAPLKAAQKYTVVLDPGHGGNDGGIKVSGDGYEKEITLLIASSVKNNLDREKDIKAYLTRSDDQSLSQAQRFMIAKKESADLILSFHINAGFDKNASGFEMYYPGFKNPAEGRNDSKDIIKDMVRNKALNESVRFARILQKNMEKVFPRKNRDLREGPIRIQDVSIPTLVLEIAFATNSNDRKALIDPDVKKMIAQAVSTSVIEYFRSPRTTNGIN